MADTKSDSLYSVTQSYANSFWGDVVLDSLNNSSREEDNILDQIYKKQMCSDFYYENLKGLRIMRILRVIEENAYWKKYSSLQKKLIKLCFSDNSMLVCIFV